MPLNWLYSELNARRTAARVRSSGPLPKKRLPIIYLPGILGVELRDRASDAVIWGDYRGILFRDCKHAGYVLDDRDAVVAGAPLHHFTIVPRLLDTIITAELRTTLERSLGYREGRDLFFLRYDWRRDYRTLAAVLAKKLEDIRREAGRTSQVIILGQSAANLAVRYLVRTAGAEVRDSIAKWYAFGPVWQGTFNALKMARDGYYPAGRRFHGFSPEDAQSFPGCYQLLPHRADLISGEGVREQALDLFDAECWADVGLGPADLRRRWAQLRQPLSAHLAAAREHREAVAGSHPNDDKVMQTWFAGTRNHAVTAVVATPRGALVTEKEIRRSAPRAAPAALAVGDDHIPLAHLSSSPCGPLVRAGERMPHGESFIVVSRAKDHRAIINHRPNLDALALDIAEVCR